MRHQRHYSALLILLGTLAVGTVLGTSSFSALASQTLSELSLELPSATLTRDFSGMEASSPSSQIEALGWNDRPLDTTTSDLSKIDHESAECIACKAIAAGHKTAALERLQLKSTGDGAVSVATMVKQALRDQARLLRVRKVELRRWDKTARTRFQLWFGTTSHRSRKLVLERINVLLQLNERFTLDNFQPANPPRPGVFAFVRPSDASKVFLDKAFVRAPRWGKNSRAGTLVHEMSHFKVAGHTRDYAYGTEKCLRLALATPKRALMNADNFEYYVEKVK